MQTRPVGPDVHHVRTQKETVDEEEEEERAAARDCSQDNERVYADGGDGEVERERDEVRKAAQKVRFSTGASPAQSKHRTGEGERPGKDKPEVANGGEHGGIRGGGGGGGNGGGAPQKQENTSGTSAAKEGGKAVRFCVNWGGQLEPFSLPPHSTFEHLASVTAGPVNAPKEHKLMIVKGKLQLHSSTLQDAGLRDGSIVHLVLNDAPERILRKPLHVQHFSSGSLSTIMCEAEEYVEGVKEELDGREGMPDFAGMRLAFAGRVLQNHHTLREYNIQKPSILSLLSPAPPRPLERYLSETFPAKGQEGVTLHSELALSFRSPAELEAEGAYWHSVLGAPILSSLLASDFQVREKFREELVEGRVHVDNGQGSRGGRVTFVPNEPLGAARHYRVTVNRNKSLWHSKLQERVQGHIAWDFFTVGYKPLRITAIYPRPHSRVPPSTPIVISFNRELYRGSDGSGWLAVGGASASLKPASYDPASRSLVFEPAAPGFPPLSSLCVRLRSDRVVGLCGESLHPLQADGLLKTTSMRWRFFTTHGRSEVSRYQYNNAESAGVAPVLKRWQEGRLVPLHQL